MTAHAVPHRHAASTLPGPLEMVVALLCLLCTLIVEPDEAVLLVAGVAWRVLLVVGVTAGLVLAAVS